jgi:hypothetical protein
MINPYEEGFKAAPGTFCPYIPFTPESIAWHLGHFAARAAV